MSSARPPVIAVLGASGGLGATTLAVAVARRLAATGPPSVVVDLDPSGGLDVTAGIEHLPGRRWPAFAAARGTVSGEAVLASLPAEDGCAVLSGGGPGADDPPPDAVADVLAALAGTRRRVVLDCPRAGPLLAPALRASDLVLVVVGLRTRALADADALVDRLARDGDGDGPDLRLVTRGPRPRSAVLDDVVAHLGVAHLHHLVDDPAVPREAERGLWPGVARDAVRRAAERVVDLVDAADLGEAS